MVEATSSLTQTQRLAQRQAQAVQVLCEWQAQEEIKDQIRRQGKIKLSKVPHSQLVRMARTALMEDAAYRERLIAEARPIVDQWTAEGFFGKRAAQRQLEHHSQHLHKPRSAGPQPLPLCETHDRNGATR
jgi:hypothetical protein